ncbi:hypothetical protein EJ02DRAFT_426702 [Clathrospora elynae]|uniref:Uncharacterized protein n=1 Tax=Clathrospora elynae TaxID=706981 RepID=A0A6A5SCL5_9PLEO|nr:hypothetical protein EJ02DRAFT_426702 [Clathrospora elynae]
MGFYEVLWDSMGFHEVPWASEDWDQFCAALKEAWLAIPNTLICKLIYSMLRCLAAVEEAHSYQTKY